MRIIGIDEAGRGPVIGPFVMCGVQLLEEDNSKLQAMGVKDSKQLTKKRREFLFAEIKTVIENHTLVIITPEEIDTFMRKGVSLNDIEAKATGEILSALSGDKAYIDCPSVNARKYAAQLKAKLDKKMELVVEHKADETYVCVGGASILAKVVRDREIEKLQKEYGDFGSGYPSDPKTKQFLQKNVDKYPHIFRHLWEPWERAAEEKVQRRLHEFREEQ